MAIDAQAVSANLHRSYNWKRLVENEDWWAVWFGLGLTLVAVALFAQRLEHQVARGRSEEMDHSGRGARRAERQLRALPRAVRRVGIAVRRRCARAWAGASVVFCPRSRSCSSCRC